MTPLVRRKELGVRATNRLTILLTTALVALGLTGGTATAAPPQTAPLWSDVATAVSVFPSNATTVFDPAQRTLLRVNLPLPDCAARPTDCNTVRQLNQLDGFDLDPRIALRFNRPVDPAAVAAGSFLFSFGGPRIGLDRVVYDAATNTVYAHPKDQLQPGSTYLLLSGLGGTGRGGLPAGLGFSVFTTLSATDGLTDMVRQLDDGTARAAAGLGAPGLQIDGSFPGTGTTFTYTSDLGSTLRTDPVPNASFTDAGTYVFGSYLAPSWLTPDGVIPQTPTRDAGPRVTGSARLPFVAILPAGQAPAGEWPVAVFGHGFTRSDADLFLAAQQNALRGMATIATDVVGHGYGPRSTWNVTSGGTTTVLDAHARGIDRDGNGVITSTEGSATLPQPAPLAQVNSRDGLRQTVADVASLVRSVTATPQLAGTPLRPSGIVYYGQSFGGIYGTMLAGVDRSIAAFGLNVPGGPISEIARLSPAFRPLVTQSLAGAQPELLNGGDAGFTESMPLAGVPPVTNPAPGALPIQRFLAEGTWLNRPGSPETFAPLAPHDRTLVQAAFGDKTVPNPTTGTLVRAGGLLDRTTLYRNDKTVNAARNPHGFLLDPTFVPGNALGQTQMSTFLASGGTTVTDPDGATGPVFEVPIADPDVLRRLNFVSPAAPVALTSPG